MAGLPRPGNSGSNTAADHIAVLDQAVEQIPTGLGVDPAIHIGATSSRHELFGASLVVAYERMS